MYCKYKESVYGNGNQLGEYLSLQNAGFRDGTL